MNPLHLTLTGFRGIKAGLGVDEVNIDLSMDGDLIAIIGPNGAGKTTVLDNLHPYRLMPSRASSYSPGAFSYYEHTYGNAKKVLRWEHGGITYESHINIKGTTKTPTQECYLFCCLGSGGNEPVKFDDGLTSDGKGKTYDECVERILGTPEMFFTAAFACQGRKALSDYPNGDIKGLMSELLGLDSIVELSGKANEVVKGARARLDAIRSRVSRAEAIPQDIEREQAALTANVDATDIEHKVRAGVADDLKAHNRRLAEAQAAAADGAATERRRATLVEQIKNAEAHRETAIGELRQSIARQSQELQDEKAALDRDATRITSQLTATMQRIDQAAAIIAEQDAINQAADQAAELAAAIEPARKALADVEAVAKQRTTLVANVSAALAALRLVQSEGVALRETCESLRARAGLTDEVPCKGTDLQGKCQLLAEAVTARTTLTTKETELEAKRAARVKALADRDAAEAALAAVPEPDVESAAAKVRDIEERARAAAALAAKKPALTAALAQAETDQAALKDANAAALEITLRLDAVAARLQALGESTASAEASIRARYATDIEVLTKEMDALPPTDTTGLQAAEQAVVNSESALERLDTNLRTLQAEAAALRERIAGLERERDSLAADVEKAARLETEIAQYTLLTKALGNDGIVALCIDDAGPTLTAICNDLLMECYGPRFSVAIRTQEQTKAGTFKEVFDLIVYDAERGDEKSIRDMSGGERVWVNDAVTSAFAIYLAQSHGQQYECLFSDESDGALDIEKKRQWAAKKRAMLKVGGYTREIFISHSAEVQECADAVIDMRALRAA